MAESATPSKLPFRVRTRVHKGEAVVRAIIRHPMETGFRVIDGKRIPAHFITDVWVYHNEKEVLHCEWSRAVAKNPFLSFTILQAEKGDLLRFQWQDNLGETAVYENPL